ncbi:MAG: hypothetical protein AB2693_19650, partial [Candidatus Thiodiazotropha sp.]
LPSAPSVSETDLLITQNDNRPQHDTSVSTEQHIFSINERTDSNAEPRLASATEKQQNLISSTAELVQPANVPKVTLQTEKQVPSHRGETQNVSKLPSVSAEFHLPEYVDSNSLYKGPKQNANSSTPNTHSSLSKDRCDSRDSRGEK